MEKKPIEKTGNETKKVFYGTSAKESKVVGYCLYHHLSLTAKQVKTRKCLKRNCPSLVKNKDHDYWKQPVKGTWSHRNDLAKRNMESKKKNEQKQKQN